MDEHDVPLEDFEIVAKDEQFFVFHGPSDRVVIEIQNADTLGTLLRAVRNYLSEKEN